MYENTGARAHVMAAELIDAGVDVAGVYKRLYEDMPFAKLELLSRALAHVERYDDGALTIARLTRDDFRCAGAEESYSEGVIDHLRSVAGTKVAAISRELLADGNAHRPQEGLAARHRRRHRRQRDRARRAAAATAAPPASRRSSPTRTSSSSCASRSPRSCSPPDAPANRIPQGAGTARMRPMDGMILCDKPEGASSHDEVLRVRRALAGAKTGHAGTLDPFATGLLLVLVGRATRIARYILTLPKTYVTTARYGAMSSTGDPDGEIVQTGRVPPDPPPMPTGEIRQRPPAYSAIRIAGVRAYERRAARGGGRDARANRPRPSLRAALARGRRARRLRDRMRQRHLHPLARSPSSATPTASRCAARASARGASTPPTARR